MKKNLLGLVAALALIGFCAPSFAEEAAGDKPADGAKAKKGKKGKKEKDAAGGEAAGGDAAKK